MHERLADLVEAVVPALGDLPQVEDELGLGTLAHGVLEQLGLLRRKRDAFEEHLELRRPRDVHGDGIPAWVVRKTLFTGAPRR